MVPDFAIEGGVPLVLARAGSVVALLSLFGTLVFARFVACRAYGAMSDATRQSVERMLLRTGRISVAAGIVATLAWLLLQSADIAGATTAAALAGAVPVVLSGTAFGHLIVLQLAALLAIGVVAARAPLGALLLAAVAVALQAGHSHAASMYGGPSVLLASVVVHLLAAGAWLGGLLPLLLLVRLAPPRAGAIAARWFSPLGQLCLVALVLSAGFQGWVLVAGIPGLVGTAYGWMVLVKLALFAILVGFALVNRYRFAPALRHGPPDQARHTLVRCIAVQTGFGVAVLFAAATLSNLPPAMHEQPLWPFAERFTLETIGEDPAFRNEVLAALLALGAAVLLLVLAAVWRHRARWLAVAGAGAIAWFAIPHLDLLFVPAYPTSYYRSPTDFAATAIVQGAALFPANCAACHGPDGRGDGAGAKHLPVPPADLTAAHLWMHSDGELFWWLSHGIEAPEGGLAMPGFARLSDEERWDLIDFLHAHNAGEVFRASGTWSPPLQAPELQADCADGRTVSLADLRGGFVRLVFGTAPAVAGITTILVAPGARAQPGLCVADDETLARAYAIVSGRPPDAPLDAQFLIDAAGWLRAAQVGSGGAGWNDPQILAGELRQLAAHPISANAGGDHGGMRM